MVLLAAIGLRKTFRLITQYPGIIFIATFTFWTIGPISKSKSKSCCQLFKQEKLGISSKYTWINLALTLVCLNVANLILGDYDSVIISLGTQVIFQIVLLITFVSLLYGDSLNNFWICCLKQRFYWCGCNNCVTTQYSVLNLSTMEEDSEMQEIMNKKTNFEEQEGGSHSRKHCGINCSIFCMILLIVLLVLTVFCVVFFVVSEFFEDDD